MNIFQFWSIVQISILTLFIVAGCSSAGHIEKIDPTLIPELRGHIRPDKKTYYVKEPIAVGYWIQNISEAPITEKVVEGSADSSIAFQPHLSFDAILVDPKASTKEHLILQQVGTPFHGKIFINSGEKKLFMENVFIAHKPGPYRLTFYLPWRNDKKIPFKPITIGVMGKKEPEPQQEVDPVLQGALSQLCAGDAKQRLQAQATIRQYRAQALPLLIELLGNDNVCLKSKAMNLLIDLKPHSIPILQANSENKKREIRIRVIYCLGQIGELKVLPTLSNTLLKDEDKDIRLTALKAISNTGFVDRIVIPLMILSLNDEEQEVRVEAIKVLRAKTGQEFGYDATAPAVERSQAIDAWQEWGKMRYGG